MEEKNKIRKATNGGEGFMGLHYPDPSKNGMVNTMYDERKEDEKRSANNIYAGTEWFAGGGGDPTKYEKSEIEIPVVEKKEERTMVNQTCENCMHKGVCKHQEIFENICKNEDLFAGVEVCLGENRFGRLTDLDFIELHRPTCKHFLPKKFTGIR